MSLHSLVVPPLSICLVAFSSAAGWALPSLDQYQMGTDWYQVTNSSQNVAQTFTVGMDGFLDHIDVYIWTHPSGAGADLSFELWDSLSGPTLYEEIFLRTQSSGKDWESFDVSSALIQVEEGQELAIVMDVTRSTPYGWLWYGKESRSIDPYSGGESWIKDVTVPGLPWTTPPPHNDNPLFDFAFRTYVAAVPEPSAALLFCSGLLALSALKRRR